MAAPEEVDLGGDTNLLIGVEPSQVRVRVNKLMLEQTSEYFRALYSPSFSEGAAASHGHDIVLKDDDPQAMLLLLRILHHRYSLPTPPTAAELVLLGVAADKYGCTEPLHILANFFFPVKTRTLRPQAVRDYAVAAYLLGNSAKFKECTESLLVDFDDPFSDYGTSVAGKLVPSEIWLILESRRNKFNMGLAFNLNHLYRSPCPVAGCPRAERWCAALRAELNELDLAPYSEQDTISFITETVSKITAPDVDLSLPNCPDLGVSHRDFVDHITTFHEYMKADRPFMRGLCMDCFRAGTETAGGCKHREDDDDFI